MSQKLVPEVEIEKAMKSLFECVGPFEEILSREHLPATLDKKPLEARAIHARMMDLERCLCCLHADLVLLVGWEYKEGNVNHSPSLNECLSKCQHARRNDQGEAPSEITKGKDRT
jgi:hypothetical protein